MQTTSTQRIRAITTGGSLDAERRTITLAFDLRGIPPGGPGIAAGSAWLPQGPLAPQVHSLCETNNGCLYAARTRRPEEHQAAAIELNAAALRHLELSRGGFFTLDLHIEAADEAGSSPGRMQDVELQLALSAVDIRAAA